MKSFCSKYDLEYELFDIQQRQRPCFPVVAGVGKPAVEVEERVVVEKPDLTEEDLKPPPPPPMAPIAPVGSVFGGGGIFGASVPFFSVPAAPYVPPPPPLVFASRKVPPPPKKRREYGVDYI